LTGAPDDHLAREANQEEDMATIGRVTEITAQSDTSFEDAINSAIARANETLRNVRSAWVKEQSVSIEDGRIAGYQVNLLVTFELDD
jgi:dodecin